MFPVKIETAASKSVFISSSALRGEMRKCLWKQGRDKQGTRDAWWRGKERSGKRISCQYIEGGWLSKQRGDSAQKKEKTKIQLSWKFACWLMGENIANLRGLDVSGRAVCERLINPLTWSDCRRNDIVGLRPPLLRIPVCKVRCGMC